MTDSNYELARRLLAYPPPQFCNVETCPDCQEMLRDLAAHDPNHPLLRGWHKVPPAKLESEAPARATDQDLGL
jgi:hypothetical protein